MCLWVNSIGMSPTNTSLARNRYCYMELKKKKKKKKNYLIKKKIKGQVVILCWRLINFLTRTAAIEVDPRKLPPLGSPEHGLLGGCPCWGSSWQAERGSKNPFKEATGVAGVPNKKKSSKRRSMLEGFLLV